MHQLGVFPEFTPLNIKHKEVLEEIAKKFPPYSDFNFVSLFTWDLDEKAAVSNLNDNIVVRFSDYSNGELFYSILGDNDLESSIDTIFKYCAWSNAEQQLKLVGEIVVNSLPLSALRKYRISEDRANHDYILSTQNHSNLDTFHKKKRKKFHQFVDTHGERITTKELDLDDNSNREHIHKLLIDWEDIRPRDAEEIMRELNAIDRCLRYANVLNISAYGSFVDGKMVAFTIFEIVHNKTAIAHFGKANTTISGANEHFEHALGNFLASLDIALINNEQDLGIKGLRKSKKSYKPVGYLKKYTISPRVLHST